MTSITEDLRVWMNELDEEKYPAWFDEWMERLQSIADSIDAEHASRMWQAEHEVRRTMARDMRWATTMLEARESRRHIRNGLCGGSE